MKSLESMFRSASNAPTGLIELVGEASMCWLIETGNGILSGRF